MPDAGNVGASRRTVVEYRFPSGHSYSPTATSSHFGSTRPGLPCQPVQIWFAAAPLRAPQSVMAGSSGAEPTSSATDAEVSWS